MHDYWMTDQCVLNLQPPNFGASILVESHWTLYLKAQQSCSHRQYNN
uniref:Uncharacterized protein n=1 Tax=Setaria italica TaxID=4555 RepID=K3Z269_SETIT